MRYKEISNNQSEAEDRNWLNIRGERVRPQVKRGLACSSRNSDSLIDFKYNVLGFSHLIICIHV